MMPAGAEPLGPTEPLAEFERRLYDDASRVARRTLRGKFGRLSNDRILALLREAGAGIPEVSRLSDDELLDRWFRAFGDARDKLRQRAG